MHHESPVTVAAYPEGYPQAPSALAELQHLQRKLDAGAKAAITQYFLDADCYLRFRDHALHLGIDKPICAWISASRWVPRWGCRS